MLRDHDSDDLSIISFDSEDTISECFEEKDNAVPVVEENNVPLVEENNVPLVEENNVPVVEETIVPVVVNKQTDVEDISDIECIHWESTDEDEGKDTSTLILKQVFDSVPSIELELEVKSTSDSLVHHSQESLPVELIQQEQSVVQEEGSVIYEKYTVVVDQSTSEMKKDNDTTYDVFHDINQYESEDDWTENQYKINELVDFVVKKLDAKKKSIINSYHCAPPVPSTSLQQVQQQKKQVQIRYETRSTATKNSKKPVHTINPVKPITRSTNKHKNDHLDKKSQLVTPVTRSTNKVRGSVQEFTMVLRPRK